MLFLRDQLVGSYLDILYEEELFGELSAIVFVTLLELVENGSGEEPFAHSVVE